MLNTGLPKIILIRVGNVLQILINISYTTIILPNKCSFAKSILLASQFSEIRVRRIFQFPGEQLENASSIDLNVKYKDTLTIEFYDQRTNYLGNI